jgi:DNA-binding CsgD family transcriptional regulator
MKETASSVFTRSLEALRFAKTARQVRRIAAQGAAQLRAIDPTNGAVLHTMLRENRDLRIEMLRAAERPRTADRTMDFWPLAKAGLTRRECEVLGWVAHGKRDAEIGAILGISKKTVSKHVEHLLSKLHAETRTAAVNVGQEHLRRVAAGKSPFRRTT